MRDEKQLNVDVHSKTLDARRRTNNGSGQLLEVRHFPQPADAESVTLWQRIRRLLTPEGLVVAGKQVSGFVVPHWAAAVLLAAIIGCMGFLYNQISSQRDMLIRLDTQLQERDKHEIEYREEFKSSLKIQELQISNITAQYNVIKGLLTPSQLRYLEQNSRKEQQ